MNFTCFSEYLNAKIFLTLAKENEKCLKLEEFTSGISLIFSQFFPPDVDLLKSTIFNLISNNEDFFFFDSLREFTNYLLFDCMCKATKHNYDFYMKIADDLFVLIVKAFDIGNYNTPQTKFNKEDFSRIMDKIPVLLNIMILLLNMLSPINNILIRKFIERHNFEIFENDDFEDEFELECEGTPRVNSLPIINLFELEFSKRYFKHTKTKTIIYDQKKYYSNNSFAHESDSDSMSNSKIARKDTNVTGKDSNCSSINNLDSILNKINNSNYNDNIFKKKINKNCFTIGAPAKNTKYSKFKKFSEINEPEENPNTFNHHQKNQSLFYSKTNHGENSNFVLEENLNF